MLETYQIKPSAEDYVKRLTLAKGECISDSFRAAFLESGAALIKNCLSEEQLAKCREVYDFIIANPGPFARALYQGEHQQRLKSHIDNTNPHAKTRLDKLAMELPFGKLLADLWGSKNVWYFAEELFMKTGGEGVRTYWHQDTSYLPWAGTQWCNAWISFEPVPKSNALEIIRGSHLGPLYDGTTFSPDDPTDPLHGSAALPRLPDIEAERAANPDAYDILSWGIEPGDVIFLHPGSLHGGANIDAACPERNTLIFRFFGDDATFRPLPEDSVSPLAPYGELYLDEVKALTPGEPFRLPQCVQVV